MTTNTGIDAWDNANVLELASGGATQHCKIRKPLNQPFQKTEFMLNYFRIFFSSEATAEAEMVELQPQQETMDASGMGSFLMSLNVFCRSLGFIKCLDLCV